MNASDTAVIGSTPPEGFGVSMEDFELLKVLGTGGETFAISISSPIFLKQSNL